MTPQSFTCFVASAFGRPDVDAVFDTCICPVLRRLHISPRRVDRVEHNDDIDAKIFELLREAHLAIVDLTYARPSVYFEGGYAAGLGKPVVYVCRSDHFRARDDDPAGNLRVHFDLQMKNIVPWSAPNAAFSRRLERRLRYVLRPLEAARRAAQGAKAEQQEFSRVAQNDQLLALSKKAQALLKARGYRCAPVFPYTVNASWAFSATRREDVPPSVVIFLPVRTLTKREATRTGALGLLPFEHVKGVKATEGHYVVASLGPVPRSRISAALPHSSWIEDDVFCMGAPGQRQVWFHIIDNIKSRTDFAIGFTRLGLPPR